MKSIRNIAIIAHVDHGKTTLVDKMLLAGQLFGDHEKPGELIMDSNDQERERGITILAKNVSINYKGTKINIIDTPGHADFGGEVERVLNMADGVLLLVDAFEGPMPQTRFVMDKALKLGLNPLVVVNKVDKPNCTPEEVHEMVFDLMFSLDATQQLTLINREGEQTKGKARNLYVYEGFGRVEVEEVQTGDICAVFGAEGFDIGDTIAHIENPEALPTIAIDEPTLSMSFTINDSPFFGKEGKYVTSRHIKDRLTAELERNLALRVEETESADTFRVFGRGVMHLSVLIETMRREGYELQIGQPQVIIKEIDGVKSEPVEEMTIDLPEHMSGTAINMVTQRKGLMLSMTNKGERVVLEFEIPSRGIIGMRSNMLTATQGEAIMTHRFKEFQPHKGDIPGRMNGSLISMELGKAIPFSINNLQERGRFFVEPGEEIYEGQVIGENNRANDLVVNVTKTKKLSNMRSSGADEKARIVPPRKFSLEEALEYIQGDEYVEATPESIRLRKILLREAERKRGSKILF